MPRARNYRAEYRRRIARGLARGMSRSQARGHPKAGERLVETTPLVSDEKLEVAILTMNQGESLFTATRTAHVSAERLRHFVRGTGLGTRRGRRWVLTDNRPRRVPVLTDGRQRTVTVDGYEQASLVGEHHHAVGQFVRTNDLSVIQPFERQSVRTISGQQIPLETDPNELHRIAAMDNPPFYEIYEITSND